MSIDDYQDRECNDCGRYQITGTLLAELAATKRWLDIEQTRLWIGINKTSGGIPRLSTFEADQQNLIRG
ncbi:hypothetical protein [Pseudomonas sp. ML2-2023-6]|uniref:hypothetical protein n=1 Tax=Pseudomonas sp. ML2-2023-6 TaxID=3122376 RepID=UPI0030CD2267